MKFVVSDLLYDDGWRVMQIEPETKHIASFPDVNDFSKAMAHDYCDFLNDKYCDKEINKEWPQINRYERIKYHLEQLQLLRSDKKLHWNEHGTGVEEGGS
jgi:hypothetical protein